VNEGTITQRWQRTAGLRLLKPASPVKSAMEPARMPEPIIVMRRLCHGANLVGLD